MKQRLFYYSDFAGRSGWFGSVAEFRKAFPEAKIGLRTSHVGIAPPDGYEKREGELAFAPAVKASKSKANLSEVEQLKRDVEFWKGEYEAGVGRVQILEKERAELNSTNYVENMKKTLCEILLQCECGLHPTLVNAGMDRLIRDVLDDKIPIKDESFIIGLPFSPIH